MKRNKKNDKLEPVQYHRTQYAPFCSYVGDCIIFPQHYVHAVLLILEPFMTRDIGRSITGNRTSMLCKRSRHAEW
jgi:hypothetical protein